MDHAWTKLDAHASPNHFNTHQKPLPLEHKMPDHHKEHIPINNHLHTALPALGVFHKNPHTMTIK